ncbi:MAG: AMP-binding protein [Oligoflexus sp.]
MYWQIERNQKMSQMDYKTPLEMFYRWEKERSQTVFLRQPIAGQWHEYNWSQVAKEVRSMAQFLHDQGLKDGARVGILSKNCAHWIMADLAIMMAGCVSVPLYPTQQAETSRYILEHSETKLVFVGKLDDWQSQEKGIPDHITKVSFPYPDGMSAHHEWQEIIQQTQPMAASPVPPIDQIATIIYTSGTTGFPKGVVHTFRGLSFVGVNYCEALGFQESERFFSYLPLAHVAERSLVEMCSLYVAAQVSFVESMETFAQNLQEVSPTAFFSVPRLWGKFQEGILQKLPQKKLDLLLSLPIVSGLIKKKVQKGLGLSQARSVGSGAAPISPALLEWYAKLGITIMEGYGQTENLAYATTNRGPNMKFGSVGQQLPNCDIKIDENTGEILIKNDAVMLGYYNEPEKTAEVLQKGYVKTGDIGEFDENGGLKITGRLKELFKTEKGKYIAPTPIENKFWDTSLIEQVCVTGHGLPNPVALLVLSESARQRSRSDINAAVQSAMASANQSLSSYEKIRQCIVVKEPWTVDGGLMTPTLKVKRHEVEKLYSPILERTRIEQSQVIWES